MLDSYASQPGWLDSVLTAIARRLVRWGVGAMRLPSLPCAAVWSPLCSFSTDTFSSRCWAARCPDSPTRSMVVLPVSAREQLCGVACSIWCAIASSRRQCCWVSSCPIGAASVQQHEKLIVYPPGLVERGEALLFAAFAGLWPQWAAPVCFLYAGLEIGTAAQRFVAGRRERRS